MVVEAWQFKAIERVRDVLAADEGVKGLVLIGSYTPDDIRTDVWSDVDIVAVVADEAISRFCLANDWISAIGEPYCFSQSSEHTHRGGIPQSG
ncbi:MAG TPA: aminoglycoside 6-adenylyltransferase [Armatimonadota bacterium]|nr:aminoglycoside 6-adenylyltransferase [Armatimonadota bacterium]